MFTRFFDKRFFAPETEEGTDPEADPVEPAVEPDPEVDPAEPAEEPDPETDPTEEAAGDEPAAPAKAATRRETRIQKLTEERNKEREARIRAEAIAEERGRQPAYDPNNSEAARVRAEKLSLMEPTERQLFLQSEEIQSLKQGQQLTYLQIQDTADKAAFDAQAAHDPVYAKHKAEVEKIIADSRRGGTRGLIPREPILDYLIGKAAREAARTGKSKAGVAKARTAAAARVETAKGTPTSARGDGAGGKKTSGDSLEDLKARILEREARGEAN